ncbi:CBS domain-containing protein [Spirillospora sp. NPDC048911]|uniref:CBS domain-containing protein n=1 Tax=Spirillospora sp. NPDC048911 TaxID=3364527 RepID=UPI00371F56FE
MRTQVEAVMTTDVVAVSEEAPFKEIVRALRSHGVDAVPVVRLDKSVCGVVSATDLLLKEADPGAAEDPHPLAGPRRRREIRKSAGTAARDLMTTPAITISPTATVEEAARLMRREHVSRLPVTDPETGCLAGIVSRSDVLRVYSRPDEQIREDVVNDVIAGQFGLEPKLYSVNVERGQVSVQGDVERRSQIPQLLHAIRRVEGVVSAEGRLEWAVDDTYAQHYPTI